MRCPTCGKVPAERCDACPRCQTELAELWGFSDRASALCAEAAALLTSGSAGKAIALFSEADRLRSTRRSRRGIAVSLLFAGSFMGALNAYYKTL
jgi:hypothetical protein